MTYGLGQSFEAVNWAVMTVVVDSLAILETLLQCRALLWVGAQG